MIKKKVTVTIEEAFNYFISTKKANNIKEETTFNYTQSYNFYIRDIGLSGKENISKLSENTIYEWIEKLKERDIKLGSINHYLADIRAFCYFCMKTGYIQPYKINLIKGQKSNLKYYTDEEIETLIKKPSGNENFSQYRTWVCCCFILATGARASTLINIKISDIDFDHKEIVYRHLKNREVAIIPLSDALAKVIREYLGAWGREKEDGWLFCDGAENQCTVSSLRQALDTYCKNRGFASKGLHALRHSFARGYIVNGGNAFKLQRLLTHSTLEMTKRYVRLFGDDLKIDYETFSPLDNMSVSKKYTIRRH